MHTYVRLSTLPDSNAAHRLPPLAYPLAPILPPLACASRWQALPDIRLFALPDSNAAHRLLPSTVALTKVAMAAARPEAACRAVAKARTALPHCLRLHLKAEDLDDARWGWTDRPLGPGGLGGQRSQSGAMYLSFSHTFHTHH